MPPIRTLQGLNSPFCPPTALKHLCLSLPQENGSSFPPLASWYPHARGKAPGHPLRHSLWVAWVTCLSYQVCSGLSLWTLCSGRTCCPALELPLRSMWLLVLR